MHLRETSDNWLDAFLTQFCKPLRAVIYGRSAREVADVNALVAAAIEIAHDRGFEIVGIYSDNGMSGSLPAGDQSEFAALMDRIGAGDIDVIVVPTLATLGRYPLVLAEALLWIEGTGIGLLTVDHGWMRSPLGTLAPDPRQ